MNPTLEQLLRRLQHDAAVVMVTVLRVQGSTPRKCGAKMLVGANDYYGTIGGGHLEFVAQRYARQLLDSAQRSSQLRCWSLGPSLGQCCGGRVQLLFETIERDTAWLQTATQRASGDDLWLCRKLHHRWADPAVLLAAGESQTGRALARILRQCRQAGVVQLEHSCWYVEPLKPDRRDVWVFGAGHVGQAVVRQLALLAANVVWLDQRPAQFAGIPNWPEDYPVEIRITADPVGECAEIPDRASVLVMTHRHDLDYEICQWLLQHTAIGFVGLIGSDTKSASFRKRLESRGIATTSLRCPVGARQLASNLPEMIALDIALQLTQMWELNGADSADTKMTSQQTSR